MPDFNTFHPGNLEIKRAKSDMILVEMSFNFAINVFLYCN